MKLDIIENITAPKKPDPKQVRKKHIKSRDIHISMKAIIGAFTVFIFLLAAISVYTVSTERSKAAQTTSDESEETEPQLLAASSLTKAQETDFNGNLLLAFTKEDTEALRMLAVVNISSETAKIKISYIPVSKNATSNNRTASMASHFESGGITELLWAINDVYNIDIDRYIYCGEKNFVDIMKYIGEIPYNAEKKVSYKYNGIGFIIEEGTQTFTADMFLKYFVYLSDTFSENTLKLTEMLMLFANNLISFENDSSPETTYDNIINYITTDISAMDISNYTPAIYSLIQNGALDNIEIVSNAEELV